MGRGNKLAAVLLGTKLLMGSPSAQAGNNTPAKDKKQYKTEVPATKPEDKTTATTAQSKSVFDKKYKIGSRAEFDKLWKDAKPFVFAAMISTENWRVDFYWDGNSEGVKNTVGVGSYYISVNSKGNLDFSASGTKMIKTSKYVKDYRNKHKGADPKDLTPDQLYLAYGQWFNRVVARKEAGKDEYHLDILYKLLKGSELRINEFAALVSVYYNSPATGSKLCKYIKQNYKSPRKCALEVLKAKPRDEGIKSRRVHETLLYLNHDNYCSEMFDKLKIDGKTGTSITGLQDYRTKLMSVKGFTNKNLDDAKKAIFNKKVQTTYGKNKKVRYGKPIRSFINTMSPKYSGPILAFANQKSSNSKSSATNTTGGFLVLYQQAGQKYHKGEYGGALELYKQALDEGGLFDDNLYNDMAMCCFHMKQYKKCIEYCKKTLNSGRRKAYMSATYNAGMAYWKLSDYDGAIRNFEAAIKYAKEFKDAKRQEIYQKKLSECTYERGTKKIQQTNSQKNAQKAYSNQQNAKNKSYNSKQVRR